MNSTKYFTSFENVDALNPIAFCDVFFSISTKQTNSVIIFSKFGIYRENMFRLDLLISKIKRFIFSANLDEFCPDMSHFVQFWILHLGIENYKVL